jgi:hypothetical protein
MVSFGEIKIAPMISDHNMRISPAAITAGARSTQENGFILTDDEVDHGYSSFQAEHIRGVHSWR